MPRGLRLVTTRATWYRLDRDPPDRWSWEPHTGPRSRFDPASGAVRVRYAGDEPRVAMRERFDRERRVVPAAAMASHVVELSGTAHVLDLRRDRVLDALGLDDQISTSRAPEVWNACQRLTDLVVGWFGERCHGIVYRSRTTPQRSANLAFFAWAPFTATDLGSLRDQRALLHTCMLYEGFSVQGWR